ncbi:MAG: YicC/YloC family endoribonuclease [Gemmobacter sp.]
MARPLASMTAFASRRGSGAGVLAGLSWSWDLRSVNGRGYEPRLRLPDGIDGLEQALRAALGARIVRGSVTLVLKLARDGGVTALRVNEAGLAAALAALRSVADAAAAADVAVAPPSAAEVLGLRGVTEAGPAEAGGAATGGADVDPAALLTALTADFAALLDEFDAMRRGEGMTLCMLIAGHLERIEGLTAEARVAAAAREGRWRDQQAAAMARLLAETPADPARLAMELALLVSRADVTEEIDRLTAHVAAARALLAEGGAVGRRLDFLTQEFLREANTLCAKAQALDLTRLGLDLKAVIEQLREQVQNLE